MKFYLPLCIIFFVCLQSCSTDTHYPENYIEYKNLEYKRSGKISAWQKIFEESDNFTKKDVLLSIAKTKNDSLFPFLKQRLTSEKDGALIKSTIFALGQLQSRDAEKLLIQYYDSTRSIKIKNAILSAFEQCGSEVCVPTLVQAVYRDSVRQAALQTAAILARKKIGIKEVRDIISDSSWSYSQTKENAYLVYNTAKASDVNLVQFNLSKAKGLAQKYYLRALLKIVRNNPASVLLNIDTNYQQNSHHSLRKILNENTSWHNTFYALKCFNYFADSTDEALVLKLSIQQNPHLQIEALKVYATIFKENSISYLLNRFRAEKSYSIKGKIILLIAEHKSDAAYRLIMQNLDKGTISFKEDLLSALALFDDKLAINSIRSYLHVNEKRLVNHSLDILNKKNAVTFSEIEELMNSEHYSVLYNVLDWQIKHKRYVDTKLLFKAFSRFKSADQFEIQDLIVDILVEKKTKVPVTNIDELLNNTANLQIYKKIIIAFPGQNKEKPVWSYTYPSYLSVDSLLTLPNKNIIVEIATNKGEIVIELLPTYAPLTVKNFLSLVEKKFYNKLTFHRVIADFVIQGGDPSGDGWGGAGYTIPSEDQLSFERGSVGIATSGFDTGSCQFFICQSEQPHLRANYTCFAQVIRGMEIVDKIMVDDVILSVTRVQ